MRRTARVFRESSATLWPTERTSLALRPPFVLWHDEPYRGCRDAGPLPRSWFVISIIKTFFRARGANLWFVLACLVVASLCEGLGLATLVPILGAATGAADQSFISESVKGTLSAAGLNPSLGTLILVLVAGMLLKSLISLLVMRKVGYANAEVANQMRLRLIRLMLGVRWGYLLHHPAGRIANSFSGEVGRSQQAYQLAAQFMAEAVQSVVMLLLAFVVS